LVWAFDTATEIGLFAIASSQSADGIPLWNIMVFPVLFAAGMALVDTLDSMLMVEGVWLGLHQPHSQAVVQLSPSPWYRCWWRCA
jgi:high-affinity nickel permease